VTTAFFGENSAHKKKEEMLKTAARDLRTSVTRRLKANRAHPCTSPARLANSSGDPCCGIQKLIEAFYPKVETSERHFLLYLRCDGEAKSRLTVLMGDSYLSRSAKQPCEQSMTKQPFK